MATLKSGYAYDRSHRRELRRLGWDVELVGLR